MKPTKLPHKRFPLILTMLLLVCFGLQAQSKNLVVIDSQFPDKEQVISSLSSNEMVLELTGSSNPWSEIRKKLESNKSIKTIHLFANASYNALQIGGLTYDVNSVNDEFELSMLEGLYQGEHLQLLIYNCNLASNVDGLALIKAIGEKAYFNVGACTTCVSIFDNTFQFDYWSINQTVSNSILKQ
ncbi:DUF4347 domain-containing protein [Maribacter sp.]|uniref:DUF4347 domain-containing protein n=1 Tax=Maribacter sp. TaxID=1897614 RepID=UPI0025BBE5E6|nr:DUF4347 domain-containing protein [Maribacter sp.]